MGGPGSKHSLPAGVLPSQKVPHVEEATSRVHAKAPAPEQQAPASDITPAERARSLVSRLVTLGPHEIGPWVRRLLPLGNFALEELARFFPEPLWPTAVAPGTRLPLPHEISASAVALATFDDEALPYLARLTRHPRPVVRYYALALCAACANSALIEPLAQATLDGNRDCRRVAVHLLREYRNEPTYSHALGALRRHAADVTQPPPSRRRAVSALTRLRDEASAALFVDLLADPDRAIETAARIGLRVLTAHDFGFAREAWLRWLWERGAQKRMEWLIEGLGDGRPSIRVLASEELWKLTGLFDPLVESDDRDAFLSAQRRYRRWRTTGQRS